MSRVLFEHRANIEDAEMAILRGHFAIVLVLSAPDDLGEEALRDDLDRLSRSLPLEAVSLREVETLEWKATPASHSLSIYGADHPGIVHAVAAALAEHEVNIVDMSTRVLSEGETAVYVMLLDVTLAEAMDERELGELLAQVGGDQGVDVSLRPIDADVL